MKASFLWVAWTLFGATMLTAATPGSEWQSLSTRERTLYVVGFEDGMFSAGALVFSEKGTCSKPIEAELPVNLSSETIASVVTTIYEDAANAYVLRSAAIHLAILKLRGEDIEKQLQAARRAGLKLHGGTP